MSEEAGRRAGRGATSREPAGDDGTTLDRVADAFEALLAMEDPAARRSFLEELGGQDPGLRREVAELFEAHLANTRFLEEALPDDDRALVSQELDKAMADRRIGPWQVDGVLHHGGMGTVYRAHRVGADFEQVVALKVIRLGTESPEIIRRFTLERQLLARLEHPAIARLLDGGTTSEGLPYLVMEYVPGDPMDVWCDREAPSMDRLLDLFQQVCAAVDFAHRNLVIHRDIKPSNILVTPDGTPKLLDFGIAKLQEVSDDATTPLTRHRMLTPAYASPEQYRGDPVSTATDVYSLGVLLYRLLTGSAPYRIEAGTTIREAERLICETMPLPPSETLPEPDPRRKRLRGDLDTIVLKALRKEPERRYASALALADDLARFRAGLPVTARPDTLAYRARRFAGRHWAGLSATAAIFLALAGGLGAALWQAAAAERERDTARAEAATAQSAVEFLKTVLWSGNPWDDTERAESVEDVLRYAEAQLEPLLGSEPATRAYILAALSEISVGRGEMDRADRFSRDAVTIMDAGPSARTRAGDIFRARSLALHELGRLAEAQEYIVRAIEVFETQRPLRPEPLAESLNQAGMLEADLGDFTAAEQWYRRAIQFRRDHGVDSPAKLLTVLNNLAVALMSQPDRLDEAAATFAEAIPVAREAGVPAPVLATLMTNQANALLLLSDFNAAEAAFLDALALMQASLGVDHPSTLTTATSLGSLHEVADDLVSAEATLRPVLTTALAALPTDHPTIAYAQNVLAAVLCRAGGGAGAREGLVLARESLRIRSAGLPAEHWALASGRSIEGLCLLELGRLDEARPLLTAALPLLVEQRGEEHRLASRVRDWLARLEQATEAAR